MRTVELKLPAQAEAQKVQQVIEASCRAQGLAIVLRDTLKSYPGSTHWHVVKAGERGVLEITFWPQGKRLWLKIQDRRTAAWIDEIEGVLKERIEAAIDHEIYSA